MWYGVFHLQTEPPPTIYGVDIDEAIGVGQIPRGQNYGLSVGVGGDGRWNRKKAGDVLRPTRFLRATFYRWAQAFSEIRTDMRAAHIVLSVGDLHIASFGTWRDGCGRLIWGVDDFDEAYPMPYANDLVRLGSQCIPRYIRWDQNASWKHSRRYSGRLLFRSHVIRNSPLGCARAG